MEIDKTLTIEGEEFQYGIERGYYQLGMYKVEPDSSETTLTNTGWHPEPTAHLYCAGTAIKDEHGFNIAGIGLSKAAAVRNLKKELLTYRLNRTERQIRPDLLC